MSGQMMSCSEKLDVVKEFISRVNPYKSTENLMFDIRGYAKYLEENKIPGNNVPPSVMEMFQKKT